MRRYTLSLLFLGAVLAGCGGNGGPTDSSAPLASSSNTGSVADSRLEDGSRLMGTVKTINVTAKSLTARASSGSFSVGSTVTVTTTTSTRFRDQNGNDVSQSRFFSLLTVGRRIEAEGTRSGTTLRASKLKIEKVG